MAKRYTAEQRAAYHQKRVDRAIASNKRPYEFDLKEMYSRNWLEGYTDPYSENNVTAATAELAFRRKSKIPFNDYDIGLTGYRNGCSARNKKLRGL